MFIQYFSSPYIFRVFTRKWHKEEKEIIQLMLKKNLRLYLKWNTCKLHTVYMLLLIAELAKYYTFLAKFKFNTGIYHWHG